MFGKLLVAGGILYALAGLAALLLVPASLHGWFGVQPDPLSAVPALLLALPWSLSMRWIEAPAPMLAWGITVLGIGINAAVLILIGRSRRARPKI